MPRHYSLGVPTLSEQKSIEKATTHQEGGHAQVAAPWWCYAWRLEAGGALRLYVFLGEVAHAKARAAPPALRAAFVLAWPRSCPGQRVLKELRAVFAGACR